jgi:hypothetical protein
MEKQSVDYELGTKFLYTIYTSGSQTFSVNRPLGSIYTLKAPPYLFLEEHKCVFVSIFILYLKNRLNKIIIVKLNVLCVN